MFRLTRPALAAAFLALTSAAVFAAPPVQTVQTPLGSIYADANGMTLYTFDNDTAGVSNCNGNCANNWPPLAAAADAVAEGDWTIVTRADGSNMWAYQGKPVYLWVRDTAAGQTTGEGVGGVWHVVPAAP